MGMDAADGKETFGTVVIAGLGMLGGSLGLALRRLPAPPRVLGLARRQASVEAAVAGGVIDAGATDPAAILPQADLTVLCLPVEDCVAFGRAQAAHWRSGAVVTDVGSVKGPLAAGLTALLAARGVALVGSHPMAGSEKSGLAAANAGLYHGATVFVTPGPGQEAAAVRVDAFWRRLGASVERLSPQAHDALVARTSHALHVLAAAAVEAVLRHPGAVSGTAGGFRDFTRIASSSPDMWAQIFAGNRTEVLAALDEIGAETARFRGLIAAGDWDGVHRYFAAARDRREAWQQEWHRRQEARP